jgi:hypothetical protein
MVGKSVFSVQICASRVIRVPITVISMSHIVCGMFPLSGYLFRRDSDDSIVLTNLECPAANI